MAVRRLAADQPASFEFTPQNVAWAEAKVLDYPQGRQASAVVPILWKAQEQHHGWLPEPAIRLVADMLKMPYIRVLEVATFYSMFQLQPVGTVAHIGVCGTTPCMLRGAEELVAICRRRIADKPFDLSADGRFSWEEVECAGACVNGPMVQIGPDTYEDLTRASFEALLEGLAAGRPPAPGPQSERRGSEPITGPTTLTSPRKDERPQGAEAAPDPTPDANVDPTSPAAANQKAARPDPRDRANVEATRQSDAPARDPRPVAPEPETSGQSGGVDEAGRQKSALEDDTPGDQSVASDAAAHSPAESEGEPSAPTTGVETIDPNEAVDPGQANRASPYQDNLGEVTGAPSADTRRAASDPSSPASPVTAGGERDDAPPAPDPDVPSTNESGVDSSSAEEAPRTDAPKSSRLQAAMAAGAGAGAVTAEGTGAPVATSGTASVPAADARGAGLAGAAATEATDAAQAPVEPVLEEGDDRGSDEDGIDPPSAADGDAAERRADADRGGDEDRGDPAGAADDDAAETPASASDDGSTWGERAHADAQSERLRPSEAEAAALDAIGAGSAASTPVAAVPAIPSREDDAAAADGAPGNIPPTTPATGGDVAGDPAGDLPEPPDGNAALRADEAGRRPERRRAGEVVPDNLQRISGIGPVLEKTLNKLGIFTLEQIAGWDQANKDWVATYLAFKNRIDRERWVEQAQALLRDRP